MARITTTIALAFFAFPAAAIAQAIPPTVPVTPPNMAPMHFLEGTWNCRIPGETASLKFTSSADGMWMLGEGSSALSSSSGTHTAHIYMTYDTAASQWVWMSALSGGGYGVLYSRGWQGSTMQWQGDVSQRPETMTFTKQGNTELRITQAVPDATGHKHMQTFTCDKSG